MCHKAPQELMLLSVTYNDVYQMHLIWFIVTLYSGELALSSKAKKIIDETGTMTSIIWEVVWISQMG